MSEADTTHAATDLEDHSNHGHGAQTLGPVDVSAWAYALAGSLLGVLTVLALFAARGS